MPRRHQGRAWSYLQDGGKRAVLVWHRRAGKDELCLHNAAVQAHQRVGNYWHCLPEYLQGRKAIWTAVNAHSGRRRVDEAFPHQLRASTNDNEMFIRFHNGSTWQVVGSDRYDATVGAAVAGITYSEYALSNPSAWAYHRPILEENNGWAAFITTPRGANHAKALFEHAQQTPGWFAERLTIEDTHALTAEQIAYARSEYVSLYGADIGRAQFEQEYMCSFTAAILGAFYALEMQAVRDEGRVLAVEHDPAQPVHTAWDLGVRHDTAIWWFQVVGAQILILDHYAANGAGLEHFAGVLREREQSRGWRTGTCFVPHDAKVKEWGSSRTRIETMEQEFDLRPELCRDASFDDGINAVRRMLPLCVFHPRTEPTGMAALEQYRRAWDDDKKAFKHQHIDDWTADTCDAFRYLALSWRQAPRREPKIEPVIRGWVLPPPVDDRMGIRL